MSRLASPLWEHHTPHLDVAVLGQATHLPLPPCLRILPSNPPPPPLPSLLLSLFCSLVLQGLHNVLEAARDLLLLDARRKNEADLQHQTCKIMYSVY